MIELPIQNRDGETVGTFNIDEADFGDTIRHKVLRQAILMYESARRVGTASTRTRSQVKASNEKPWRQKGTGRARAGSRTSPIWRGGGVVFGPHPRDHRQRMPKKAVRAATRSAYLAKFQHGTIVLDELSLAEPRTRDVARTLDALGVDRGCLIATEAYDETAWKSARNLPRVAMKPVSDVNAYDLLRHPKLVITRAALEKLVASMKKTKPAAAAVEAETNE
jgi:large subunit ribosomal protein L4